MMDLIPEENSSEQKIYIMPKTITAEGIINNSLWFLLAVLLLAMLSTFFVEKVYDVEWELGRVAADYFWLTCCSLSISEILKIIFRNKGRGTDEYKKAKTAAQTALAGLTDEELALRKEYCEDYEKNEYENCFNRILQSAGLEEKEYKKYSTYSKKRLKKCTELSAKQKKAVVQLNNLVYVRYDPDYFLSTDTSNVRKSPSERYDSRTENRENSIISILFATLGSFGSITFAFSITFSLSPAAIIAAVVKVATITIIGTFKAICGWNLSGTEINRYNLIVKECSNLKAFYKSKIK